MDFNLQACQSARTVPSLFNSIKPSKLYMYLKLDSSPRVSRQKKCEQRLRGFFMLILTGMINSFCAWFCDENSFFKTLAEGAHTENENFYHKESAQIFIDFFGDLTGYGKHQPFQLGQVHLSPMLSYRPRLDTCWVKQHGLWIASHPAGAPGATSGSEQKTCGHMSGLSHTYVYWCVFE